MSAPLQDKVAIVTGGSRGIGLAIAEKLAGMGCEVVITARKRDELEKVAQSIRKTGGKCEGVPCDVSSLSDVQQLAGKIGDRPKKLKIVINNAGIGGFSSPLHETDPETWDKIINTNLRGVYYMIRAFAPILIANGGGDIVNISSLAGKNALPNGATYSASKWGLNGLSYSVAEELRAHNIRVTVVCPGSVNTDLSPHTGKNLSKMLQPADVAHVVAMVVTQAPQSFASEILLRPTQKP
ncbi:MAG TPA: SDR family NAD(P)-dependent oxidoreductase [Terriglobales bacterium]|nr:SDR family NAD(P)-dependent oxidoreductase [Terriglobales bacterium]